MTTYLGIIESAFQSVACFADALSGICNIALVAIGVLAMYSYRLQARDQDSDSASLIILQIKELQERIRKISESFSDGIPDIVALYEQLPIMAENYWEKYKHRFVREIDADSFAAIDLLFQYASEIQEQQIYLKSVLHEGLSTRRSALEHLEVEAIKESMREASAMRSSEQFIDELEAAGFKVSGASRSQLEHALDKVIPSMPTIDENAFWMSYGVRRNCISTIIDKDAVSMYTPSQIMSTLQKVLAKCALLEVKGTEGYKKLERIASRPRKSLAFWRNK